MQFGDGLYDMNVIEGFQVLRRLVRKDDDITPEELSLFRQLFPPILREWSLDPATVTIEKFLEETDEHSVTFTDLQGEDGDYSLIYHSLGGNTHGYFVDLGLHEVVAELSDGAINYQDSKAYPWPQLE